MARTAVRAPAEQRRTQILDAAQACFTERGYHETTVDEIAERCGLSKGAIYWHFPGKRELFLALFDRYTQLAAEGIAAAGEPASAAEGLRRWAEVTLLTVPEVVPLAELILEYMAHASRDDEVRTRIGVFYDELSGSLRREIERGIADGSFRSVDPETTARVLFALGDGLLMQKIAFPDLDLADAAREGIDILLRGLEQPKME